MGKSNDELERLKRLREWQLRQRDPTAKDKAFYSQVSQRQKANRLTFRGILKDLRAKWLYMLVGGMMGLLAAVLLNQFVQAYWVQPIGYVLVFSGIAMGRVMGAVIDWRDEDWGRKY